MSDTLCHSLNRSLVERAILSGNAFNEKKQASLISHLLGFGRSSVEASITTTTSDRYGLRSV
ncbi:MAG TPA: hypothetical protein PLO56_01105 [Rhodothermales bacterium]|nr:hypothetical protein [Rhodothermales bacterium]